MTDGAASHPCISLAVLLTESQPKASYTSMSGHGTQNYWNGSCNYSILPPAGNHVLLVLTEVRMREVSLNWGI